MQFALCEGERNLLPKSVQKGGWKVVWLWIQSPLQLKESLPLPGDPINRD